MPSTSEVPLSAPKPEPGQTLPDLVVFDLLGVLLPERPRIAACLGQALAAADLPVDAEESNAMSQLPTRAVVGQLVSRRLRLAPEVARPLVGAIVEDFRERVLESLKGPRPLAINPGAAILLAELAADGVHIGIDSELEGSVAAALIRQAGWAGTGLIEAVVGSDEVLVPRPGPGQVEEVRRRCGLGLDARVVKVVGTAIDAQAALGAGCDTVYSLQSDLVVGMKPVSDLGDLAERILGRLLI